MRKSTKHIILFIFLDFIVGILGFIMDIFFYSLSHTK